MNPSDDPAVKAALARVIAYRPIFRLITGSIESALMLSQAWFWYRSGKSSKLGHFWKTREQWERETGLGRRQQDKAKTQLGNQGFMTVVSSQGMKTYYFVNVTKIYAAIDAWAKANPQEAAIRFPEVAETKKPEKVVVQRPALVRK